MYVSVLAERASENAGYQRRVCCSGPGISVKNRRCPRGCRRGLLQIGCKCSKKGRHRPAGDRDWRRFGLAANPLQMQPDGARDRSVA
jgi:hypothetical protein